MTVDGSAHRDEDVSAEEAARTGSASLRILVFGASGFLGSNVLLSLFDSGAAHELIAHTSTRMLHSEVRCVPLDLRVPTAAGDLVRLIAPDLVINCAALADVDACERSPELARALNTTVPAALARACGQTGAGFVHVSTDAVFDGSDGPYTEGDAPSPLNVYGRTKADGEQAVLDVLPRAIVARTNIVGWSPTGVRSLLEYFHGNLEQSLAAPGYTDILFRPLPVHHFWPGCARLFAGNHPGIQHLTGPELLSKFDFGRKVAAVFGFDDRLVVAATGRAAGRRAARAPSLDVRPSAAAFTDADRARSIDRGLRELAELARDGLRGRLRGLLTA